MRKILMLVAVLVIAAGSVWLLNSMSQKSLSGQDEHVGLDENSTVLEDIRALCKNLESNQWNKAEYENIQQKINVDYGQGLITTNEKRNLEVNLRSAYAESLNLAFKKWKSNCAENSSRDLYREIKEVSNYNTTCKEKLTPSYSEINGYYKILSVTRKVDDLIKNQYESNSYKAIEKKLNSLPTYYDSCEKIKSKKDTAKRKLYAFEEFVKRIENHYRAHNSYPNKYTLSDLESDYRESREQGYVYYENLLKTDGFDKQHF
jgi:hypothetical protein